MASRITVMYCLPKLIPAGVGKMSKFQKLAGLEALTQLVMLDLPGLGKILAIPKYRQIKSSQPSRLPLRLLMGPGGEAPLPPFHCDTLL